MLTDNEEKQKLVWDVLLYFLDNIVLKQNIKISYLLILQWITFLVKIYKTLF